MMKATANPMTLYFDRKSLNSFHTPLGGVDGGVGFGVNSSRIRVSSFIISSSFDIYSPLNLTHFSPFNNWCATQNNLIFVKTTETTTNYVRNSLPSGISLHIRI
jgi:hypothetical protein